MATRLEDEVIDRLYDQKLLENAAYNVDIALGRLFVQYRDMKIYEDSPSQAVSNNPLEIKELLYAIGLVRDACEMFDYKPESRQWLEHVLRHLCDTTVQFVEEFSGTYFDVGNYELTPRGTRPNFPFVPGGAGRGAHPLTVAHSPNVRAYQAYTTSQLGEYTVTPPRASSSSERYSTNEQGQTVFRPDTVERSVNEWILSHETGGSLYKLRLAFQFLRSVYQLCWIIHRAYRVQVNPDVLRNMENVYNMFKVRKLVPFAAPFANRVRTNRRRDIQQDLVNAPPMIRLKSRPSSAPKNMEEGSMRSQNFHNKGFQNYLAHGRSKSDTSEHMPARRTSDPSDFTRSSDVVNEYSYAQRAYHNHLRRSSKHPSQRLLLRDMDRIINTPSHAYAFENKELQKISHEARKQGRRNTARFYRNLQQTPRENQRALFLQSSRPYIRSGLSPYARLNPYVRFNSPSLNFSTRSDSRNSNTTQYY